MYTIYTKIKGKKKELRYLIITVLRWMPNTGCVKHNLNTASGEKILKY